MYAKLFSSILVSSIWDQPADVCKVWVTMLAMADRSGDVFGAESGVAHMARLSVETTQASLQILLAPDALSGDLLRNPDAGGRRIARTPLGWRILNYPFYREMRDADVRREQNRDAQRRIREKTAKHDKPPSAPVVGISLSSSSSSSSAYPFKTKRRASRAAFVPPTIEEVREHAAAKKSRVDPETFLAYHEARGWMLGKVPMKNWRSAWVTFEKNEGKFGVAPTVSLSAANPSAAQAAAERQAEAAGFAKRQGERDEFEKAMRERKADR